MVLFQGLVVQNEVFPVSKRCYDRIGISLISKISLFLLPGTQKRVLTIRTYSFACWTTCL